MYWATTIIFFKDANNQYDVALRFQKATNDLKTGDFKSATADSNEII